MLNQISAHINPFDNEYQEKAWTAFRSLSPLNKTIVMIASIALGLLTLPIGGIGGFAAFRCLSEKFKITKANLSQDNIAAQADESAQQLLPDPSLSPRINSPKDIKDFLRSKNIIEEHDSRQKELRMASPVEVTDMKPAYTSPESKRHEPATMRACTKGN